MTRNKKLLTLPNLITLLRIGTLPLLVIMLYLPGKFWSWAAGVIFFIAGLTDLLDGWLARRLQAVTRLGQYLDPVADKLLIAAMLVMLTDMDRVPAWITIIIISREIAVTGLRVVAAHQRMDVPSDTWGKWKTTVQIIAVALLILHYPLPFWGLNIIDPHLWGTILLWIALLLTVWSGLLYGIRFWQRLEAKAHSRKTSF